jgi:hypothetical protein
VEPALRRADGGTPPSRPRRVDPLVLLLGVALVAGMAIRLRFFGVPLTTDEGGYAVVADWWADGATLYDQAWVDRPQLLVLLYRAAWAAGPAGIRILALVATAATAIAVAWAARSLHGRRAAVAAGVAYLLVSPAPRLEGWAANGELLASAVSTTGIACLLAWSAAGHRRARLLAAGVLLVSAAPLIKQSAVEGVLVAIVLIAPHARARLPALGWAALPWLVAVAHGATVGLDRWWFAVVGYRLHGPPAADGLAGRAELLLGSLPPLLLDAAPLIAIGVVGTAGAVRLRRMDRRHGIYAAWVAGGVIGVVGGGLFHTHYWLQLLPVGCVAVGAVFVRMPRRAVPAAVAGTAVMVVAWAPLLLSSSAVDLVGATTRDPRMVGAQGLAHELATRTGPDDTILVVWASASVYAYADREPATPYLWFRPLRYIDGAVDAVVDRVGGSHPPAAIVVVHPPQLLDYSGELSRLLASRYTAVTSVRGVPVYVLRR